MCDKFITELNKKHEAAWYRMYEEYYPALCAYAARITKDKAAVEDIVQDCLIGLWKSSLKFPDVKALTAWLYRAVYTRSLNLLRDRANAQRLLYSMNDEDEGSEDSFAVDIAIEEAVVARFRLVLSELSVQQRKVLQMSMDGLKVREIADCLGVTENTVKMLKKRAYMAVRERMGRVWLILWRSFFPNIFENF